MSINSRKRTYNYYTMNSRNAYGELLPITITSSLTPTGTIDMDIEVYQQSMKDNVLYSGAQYIGIAQKELDDNTLLDYNGKTLKVLYCNPNGRRDVIYFAEV